MMIRKFIGSAVALAIVASAAAPAAARPYWRGHHHRGGGDTFGNILLGAVIGGGLFAVANSANRNKGIPSRRGADQRDDLRDSGDDAREVASMCTSAVERMAHGPVSTVDSVGRDGEDSWKVDGVVRGDRGDREFLCEVRQGEIENVRLRERLASR